MICEPPQLTTLETLGGRLRLALDEEEAPRFCCDGMRLEVGEHSEELLLEFFDNLKAPSTVSAPADDPALGSDAGY